MERSYNLHYTNHMCPKLPFALWSALDGVALKFVAALCWRDTSSLCWHHVLKGGLHGNCTRSTARAPTFGAPVWGQQEHDFWRHLALMAHQQPAPLFARHRTRAEQLVPPPTKQQEKESRHIRISDGQEEKKWPSSWVVRRTYRCGSWRWSWPAGYHTSAEEFVPVLTVQRERKRHGSVYDAHEEKNKRLPER